ncbi:MAG TPA: hypothetical protein VHE53_03665 [Patescibacteria group bacterium]|nr:hypothetical protein [Patescibacteria group bacterium]
MSLENGSAIYINESPRYDIETQRQIENAENEGMVGGRQYRPDTRGEAIRTALLEAFEPQTLTMDLERFIKI